MLRHFYDRVIALSERPAAPFWLFAVAFAEASFFPIPPDAMLIPMALARPRRAFGFAAIATAGSVIGGMLGYLIGYALLAKLAQPLIDFYHYHTAFVAFQQKFARYGVWVILIKGLTPIPYKIVTIAAGAAASVVVVVVVELSAAASFLPHAPSRARLATAAIVRAVFMNRSSVEMVRSPRGPLHSGLETECEAPIERLDKARYWLAYCSLPTKPIFLTPACCAAAITLSTISYLASGSGFRRSSGSTGSASACLK